MLCLLNGNRLDMVVLLSDRMCNSLVSVRDCSVLLEFWKTCSLVRSYSGHEVKFGEGGVAEKEKAPTGDGQGLVAQLCINVYSFLLLRITKANPARPPPRSRKVEGSGTGVKDTD